MIYIPKEFMVGFQRRVNYKGLSIDTDKDNEYVLGYATYKDEKGKIRCETSWKKWKHDENPVLTFTNIGTPGFKIVGTETRGTGGWSSTGRSVFDVIDPRGFVLQINSGNLIEILKQCDLKQGVIQNPCLWSWAGQNLILVPEGTDLYEEGIESYRLKNKKIKIKDISLGDEITLQDGSHGIWLGSQYITKETQYPYFDNRDGSKNKHEFIISQPIKRQFFLKYGKGKYREGDKYLEIKTSYKISEITKKADPALTAEEVSELIMKHVSFYKNKTEKNKNLNYNDRDRSTLDGWDYFWDFDNYIHVSPKKPLESNLLEMFKDKAHFVKMWDEKTENMKKKEYEEERRRNRRW